MVERGSCRAWRWFGRSLSASPSRYNHIGGGSWFGLSTVWCVDRSFNFCISIRERANHLLKVKEETMNKRLLYSVLAILACTNLATIAADDKSAIQKPNIIFILSDDVGLGNVHCTGGHYNTPNIDVPLIINWPGVTPAGKVSKDLTDFSDFFGTFAELGGAKLPEGVKIDSRSIAPQIKGEKGTPRDWVYVELSGKSYVRDARYKLTNQGELFDLKNSPFEETPVSRNTTDADALAAMKKLQAVLESHPAGDSSGIVKKKKAKNAVSGGSQAKGGKKRKAAK